MSRAAPARCRRLLAAAALLVALSQTSVSPAAAASATTFSPTTVPLAPGQSVTVTIQVTGLAANVNGGQWAIVHPTDGSVTLTNASCTGIFGGAALLGPSAQPYGTLVACGYLTGTVSGTSGNALTFTLTRVSGSGPVTVSFQPSTTYYIRNDGTEEAGGQLGTLTLAPPATATPSPTPSPPPTSSPTAAPSATPTASPAASPTPPSTPSPTPTAPVGPASRVTVSPLGGSAVSGDCTFTPLNGGMFNAQCNLSGLTAAATVTIPLVGGGSTSLSCPAPSGGAVACGASLPGSPQLGGSVTVTVGGTVVANGTVGAVPPSPTPSPTSPAGLGPAPVLPPFPPPPPLLPPVAPPAPVPALPVVPDAPRAEGVRLTPREVPVIPEASALHLLAGSLAIVAGLMGFARWRRER